MALDDLLTMLERRGVDTPDTPCNPAGVSAKSAQIGDCTRDTPNTPQKVNVEIEARKADGATLGAASCWWRLHYADNPPKEVSYCPPVTHAEALAGEPDAISAQPFQPVPRQPKERLSERDETLIRVWLARINETNDEMIAAVLNQCRRDADAKTSYIHLAQQK